MNLSAARDELKAAASAAGLVGYREPPGEFVVPALVVLDPEQVNYHATYDSSADTALFRVRVIVGAQLGHTKQLDDLLSGPLLDAIEKHETDVWAQAAVLRKVPGPYLELTSKAGKTVGLAADVEVRITFP